MAEANHNYGIPRWQVGPGACPQFMIAIGHMRVLSSLTVTSDVTSTTDLCALHFAHTTGIR